MIVFKMNSNVPKIKVITEFSSIKDLDGNINTLIEKLINIKQKYKNSYTNINLKISKLNGEYIPFIELIE